MTEIISGQHPQSAQFILFGAMGDLAWRLVGPALFNLYLDGLLSFQNLTVTSH